MIEKIYPVEHELGLKLPEIISKLFNNCEPVLTAATVNGYGKIPLSSDTNLVLPIRMIIKNKLFKVHAAVLFREGKTPLIRKVGITETDDELISAVSNNWIIPKAELQGVHSVYLVGAMPRLEESNVLTNGKFLGYYLRTLQVYSNCYVGGGTKRIISDKLNIRVMQTEHYKRVVLNVDVSREGYSLSPIVFVHPTMQKLCHVGDSNSFIFTYNKANGSFVLQQPYLDDAGKPTRRMQTLTTFDSTEQALKWFRIRVANLTSSDKYDIIRWLSCSN